MVQMALGESHISEPSFKQIRKQSWDISRLHREKRPFDQNRSGRFSFDIVLGKVSPRGFEIS